MRAVVIEGTELRLRSDVPEREPGSEDCGCASTPPG